MNAAEHANPGGRPAGPFTFPPVAWAWLLVSVVVIVLDWYTKQIASHYLELYRPVEVFGWLNMTLAHNYGAAFSFLADAGGWQRWFFGAVALGFSSMVTVWLWRLPAVVFMLGLGSASALTLVENGRSPFRICLAPDAPSSPGDDEPPNMRSKTSQSVAKCSVRITTMRARV